MIVPSAWTVEAFTVPERGNMQLAEEQELTGEKMFFPRHNFSKRNFFRK